MNDFFEKEEYYEADLIQLIDDDIEESTNLEFKSAGALSKSDGKKREIAKDVSAIANSDGGIIIYGMNEEDHKASELSYINGNDFSKEWLEQVINTNIHRKIKGLKIYPVRFDKKIEQTIYVVKIPPSSWAPHMSKDKRYYRRYNFEVLQMEEYEVRNLFNRREKTDLILQDIKVTRGGTTKRGGVIQFRDYNLECSIKNISNSVEEFYKLQLAISSNILSKYNDLRKYFDRTENGNRYYSIPGNSPIFQDEIITMFNAKFTIEQNNLELAETEFRISLMYSNGIDEVDNTLLQAMHDNGIDLSNDFN